MAQPDGLPRRLWQRSVDKGKRLLGKYKQESTLDQQIDPRSPGATQGSPSLSTVTEEVASPVVEPPAGSGASQRAPPNQAASQLGNRPGSTVASQPGPEDDIVQPTRLQTLWYSKNTPKWNEAVENWKTKHRDEYDELGKKVAEITESRIERADELFQLKPPKTSSKQIAARLKRWLPSLAAVRGIAMSVAALDPHKIAPIICASVFFSIDILFNSMNPEDRDKILDILFECGNTINEGISFETTFLQRTHPNITDDFPVVEDLLIDQYVRALRLLSNIQRSCNDGGPSIRDRLTNKILVWEHESKEISRQRNRWSVKKKILEEKLASDKYITEVLSWIKKDGDPEPKLDTIKRRVMPDGRYGEAAQWFLDGPKFTDWYNAFQSIGSERASKRVLWVRGGYGTGKTTLLYHVHNALKDLPEFHIRDYETIIRSMASRLSLSPDFTLLTPAERLHSKSTSAQGHEVAITMEDWEQFFSDVLDECSQSRLVFLVDALDECDLRDAERLLDFMGRIMDTHPNVHMLCSSHQQVRVRSYFDAELLQETEVTPEATADEMDKFISNELQARRKNCKESIFYKPDHSDLLDELQQTLIKNARGMFRWVQVWLEILLPSFDDRNTIRSRKYAKEQLDKLRGESKTYKHDADQLLEAGYQRLWDLNNLAEFQELRIRLFHLVLGSFEPHNLTNVREALRIQGCLYYEDLTDKDVKRLYSNFLYETEFGGLRFIHDSARKFVLNMSVKQATASGNDDTNQFSERNSHLSIARLYIEVMKLSTHPFWKHLGLDPSNWSDVISNLQKRNHLRQDLHDWSYSRNEIPSEHSVSLHIYLSKFGLRHCARAAKERSMFDELWTEVLDSVILPLESAFGFVTIAQPDFIVPYPRNSHSKNLDWNDCRYILGQHKGRIELLHSHVLALLNIISEDDFCHFLLSDSRMETLTGEPEKERQRLLFKHAARRGGGVSPFPEDPAIRNVNRTALHVACWFGNRAAVDMILQAAHLLSGGVDSANLLWQPGSEDFPFCMAVRECQFDIAATLLNFEKQHARKTGGDQPLDPTADLYMSKQWLLLGAGSSDPALILAVTYLREDEICQLLSIAQPNNIDVRDYDKATALHYAAGKGFLRLSRELVEKYGATTDSSNCFGMTPAYYAAMNHHDNVFEYLKSRGAIVNFKIEDIKAGVDLLERARSRRFRRKTTGLLMF